MGQGSDDTPAVMPAGSETVSALDGTQTLLPEDGRTMTMGTASQGPSATGPGRTAALTARVGHSLGGRYRLRKVLGRGSFGQVWSADDTLTGARVAIKELDAIGSKALAAIRRELTALRWVRLPGVVRLLDDGFEGDAFFIVMTYVAGAPFPGEAVERGAALEARAARLLEVLHRLHCAGVIHRDLKPANVIVDAQGRPTLLDLGLARGRAVWPAVEGRFEGTPRYAAPEQRLGQTDARSDLYSVGIMLRMAAEHLIDAAPPPLARLIAGLTEARPEDRPQSALAALRLLGDHSTEAITQIDGLPPTRCTVTELQPLFDGPEPFFHVPSDAAEALWRRTGGHPHAVKAEVEGWIRAGLAHGAEGRVVIERWAIDQLAAGLPVAVDADDAGLSDDARSVLRAIRLAFPAGRADRIARISALDPAAFAAARGELIAAERVWALDDRHDTLCARPVVMVDDADSRAVRTRLADDAADALDALRHRVALEATAAEGAHDPLLPGRIASAARAQLDAGRLDTPLLTAGIDLARARGRVEDEHMLLAVWVRAALADGTLERLNEAQYLLDRAMRPATALEVLVRATRAAISGEAARALELYGQLGPFEDDALEVRRQAVQSMALQQVSTAEWRAAIEGLSRWATTDRRRAARWLWLGLVAYVEGRYDDAAAAAARSSALSPDAREALRAMVNAASAQLEALDFEAALSDARAARRYARRLRLPRQAAACALVERMAAYRTDDARVSEPELVLAVELVALGIAAPLSITEAAVAWRWGRPEARALAERAVRLWSQLGVPSWGALARSLALAAGVPPEAGEIERLRRFADRCAETDLSVQILGLLQRIEPSTAWQRRCEALAACRPPSEWQVRLDVLSFDECVNASRKISGAGG